MALDHQLENISIPTYIVDSFTDKPFAGNPAGVCIIRTPLSSDKMWNIAKELGFSETAFVIMTEEQKQLDKMPIRFFSPKMEIPLCGHATLAASKVVFEYYKQDATEIHFSNINKLNLKVVKEADLLAMTFPTYNTEEASVSDKTLEALGIDKVINTRYNRETNILLLEISESEVLQNLNPNYNALVQSQDTINGIVVTAVSNDSQYDFHSRYFWPWSGTNEDPATGGTHTFLAPYWSKRLGKKKMKSYQSSERTGWMFLELTDQQTVIIKSQANIVLSGHIK